MISPEEFEREYGAVYKYSSPPIMPGIRRLAGVPEERHIVTVDLETVNDNFMPSQYPEFNMSKCGRRVPVTSATGIGLEGFGHVGMRFFIRMLVFALVIALICYVVKKN